MTRSTRFRSATAWHAIALVILALANLTGLTGRVCAADLSSSELRDLLGQIRAQRAASPHVHANFREEKTLRLMTKPIVSSGEVWFEAPNKFRREVRGTSPSVTVSDGTQLWIYYPNFKSAEHYPLGKRSPVDSVIAAINAAMNLQDVEATFQIEAAKIDKGYELKLTPRTAQMKRMFQRMQMRLSPELFAERTEMVQPSGDRIVTTYSNQSRAPIARSTFEFAPPPGTDVTTPLGR
jgi:outer membrane lipoprotein-sorting protein